MTDHDQTTLDLMHERRRNRDLRTMNTWLCLAVIFTIVVSWLQSSKHHDNIAALTAKCGPEER